MEETKCPGTEGDANSILFVSIPVLFFLSFGRVSTPADLHPLSFPLFCPCISITDLCVVVACTPWSLQEPHKMRGKEVAQLIMCWLQQHEDLSSIPSIHIKKCQHSSMSLSSQHRDRRVPGQPA